MMSTPSDNANSEPRSYGYDTLVKGQPARIQCADIFGQRYAVARGPVTILGLEDDWYEDVSDPEAVIETLRSSRGFKPDLFTFWQRLPDTEPKFKFRIEWEEIAVLPIESYDHWFNRQIKSRVRNQIRKAEKEGVTVRETTYDDEFIRGMTAIFNEAPVRQGRRFWHYGKDFETVKRQFSRYLHREDMIAAYHQGEMIGLIMLGNAGHFGLTGQIISAIKYRDKATNNLPDRQGGRSVCREKASIPLLPLLEWRFAWRNSSAAAASKRRVCPVTTCR